MRKNYLNKVLSAVIAATTIGSFSSLGVSAATTTSNMNGYYNTMFNNILNKGWVLNAGKWYYFDNAGRMQTGVINVNGKTYCLNPSGIMEVGKVTVNNKTYTTSTDGQVVGTTSPTVDKVFDSNNNMIINNNKPSTVSTSNTTQNTNTNTQNTATTTQNTNTSTQNTTNNTTNTPKTNVTTNNVTNSGNSTSVNNVVNNTTTTTTQTGTNSADVQGLPKLPTNYSITVQASAEQKILELMNAKRAEAGLQPLTMDNTLLQVARYKSNNMVQNNFFSHTNPDGTKWTNWLQTIGYKYTTSGENIAYNTNDPVELFNQWWNSPGHKANMMNASYNKVGIGVIHGNGKYMGTQIFSN